MLKAKSVGGDEDKYKVEVRDPKRLDKAERADLNTCKFETTLEVEILPAIRQPRYDQDTHEN